LKAHNKLHETPLHSAAKVGNVEFLINLIRLAPREVNDVLGETNYHGKTASYIAVKHGHERIFHKLMNLDRTTVCKEGISLLHLAISKGCTSVVDALLNYNPDLVYHQESNGSFPIHLAVHAQNVELVLYFLKCYPDSGGLLNSAGQNAFHIAAEKNMSDVFTKQFKLSENSPHLFKMVSRMVNATDNEGNTPLHIAAMKGCRSIMLSISEANKKNNEQYLQRNYKGLTPFDLSVMHIKAIKGDNCNNKVCRTGIRFFELLFIDKLNIKSTIQI
jgi:ankyrin repeat protein